MRKLSKILLICGSILLGIFTFIFISFNGVVDREANIDPSIWGQYGDIIGGVIGTIFSLVGVLLLVETLRGSDFSQTENRIFELIKFHKENTNEISTISEMGRLVFKNISEEISILYQEVCNCECLVPEEETEGNPINEYDKLDVAYLIAFFGLDINGNQTLTDKVCAFTGCNTLMKKTIECIPSIKDKFPNRDNKVNIHTGYQVILGHYFRHLFQTVNYINNQKNLPYSKKYFFTKTLRAQLSTYEQIIFFYNSVSPLGADWELSIYNKNYSENELNAYKIITKIPIIGKSLKKYLDYENNNNKLITKYNFIKNIPSGMCCVDPRELYDNVEYEGENKSKDKSEMEKYYT